MTLTPPSIALDSVAVTTGQRYAVFKPRLVDASGSAVVASQDMDATWRIFGGWAAHDYTPASGTLRWRTGNLWADEGEIVVALGPTTYGLKTTRPNAFGVDIHIGDGVSTVKQDISAYVTVQAPADAARPALWALPMDQASLDAIRPQKASSGLLRSTFDGYNTESGETGVDIYNGQVPGLSPFVRGPDGRVHLRCLPLPSPIKASNGQTMQVGQARLIAPTLFQPGDLVEWDIAHVNPGWLITWTTGEFGWPAGGEIDMEFRPDWCASGGLNMVQHYPGASASGEGGIAPLPDVDLNSPHVRSLEWSADGTTIIARVNGIERQRWPMMWNGKPQIVVTQATAYLPFKSGELLPELSIGSWTHYRQRASR